MKYCSVCGSEVRVGVPAGDNRPRHICDQCGTIHYHNPKVVAGCIAHWEDKVLMCRRAIEPRLGLWTVPAGFMKLETTRVLLTGAAGGIGSAIAEKLAARGANLALLGRNDDETGPLADRLKADGAIVYGLSADLLDREAREQAINEAHQRLGGIDMMSLSTLVISLPFQP